MSVLAEREAAAVSDALRAIAGCLRHLACDYGLMAAERAACLRLLETTTPGIDPADLQAAVKLLQAPRRLTGRQREKASELSLRLAERAVAVR
jgi:hypothetical protein